MPHLSEKDRLDMTSPHLVSKNLEALATIFPNCITETENGKAVDFDLLKQELSHQVIEGNKERYRLEWPGKREAIVTANLPTTKTLRPVREDSVNFDNTENLYIEGDNLEVLKLLQESYFGKIKMIYIDPPYNTGKDFVYKDNFAQSIEEFKEESGLMDEQNQRLVANPETSGRYHSDWLSMMYPRLKLARNLLTEDGVIFISIGEDENHNLKKLCEEIFGSHNIIGSMVWQSKKGGGSDSKTVVEDHEYIITFARNINEVRLGKIYVEAEPLDREDAEGKYYRGRELNKWGSNSRRSDRPTMWFPIKGPEGEDVYPIRNDGEEGCWRFGLKSMLDLQRANNIEFVKRNDGTYVAYEKIRNQEPREKPYRTWVTDVNATSEGSIEVRDLFEGKKVFDFPKPISILTRCLQIGADADDIVLDFFSGSASIVQAIFNFNINHSKSLKFICVQLPENLDKNTEADNAGFKNICEIGKERIRRTGKKLLAELAQKNTSELNFSGQEPRQIDTGFRVYRLDTSNMQDVYYRPQDYQQDQLDIFSDNIKPDRNADDLLAQVMLDWGLPLSYRIEQFLVLGKKVFRVAQDSLLACFDKEIDEAFAKEIAAYHPLRVVFRDQSFKDDTAKENVRQLVKQLSPDTEMRVI